jgi:hypothetical protein
MTIVLNGTTGITTPTYNGSTTAEYLVPVTGFKNRIINGDMTIDQRNAGASVTPADAAYTLDRYGNVSSQSSKFSVQQNAGSVTPPVGFANYLGVTSLSAYSVPSNELFTLYQNIEGFNTADLQWGTANAKTVTLSFWVRSSLTGTFGGSVANNAFNRSYPYSYTISAANTWEFKSITIAGDTTGTWVGATNGIGMRVYFPLGVGADFSGTAGAWAGVGYVSATGATSVVGTNGATFYITGVQLEVGSNATSFDYLPYGTELALCQRYFWQQGGGVYCRFAGGIVVGRSSTLAVSMVIPPVPMRVFPTVTTTNLGNTNINSTAVSSISLYNEEASTNIIVGPIRISATLSGGLTNGTSYEWESNNNATTRLSFSSEL